MITRRHLLGSFAAAAMLPSRGFAHVAPPRSEIREALARHFADAGTAGTFVGYKVDDYLVIASDTDRSGEAKLPATSKPARGFCRRTAANVCRMGISRLVSRR